jgi:Zn-dependent M28 family amino/carboxypeptidase
MGQDPAGWFPGADDNASGVAAILSAIRGIRPEWEAKKDRRVGVAIVFFDAEEWGLLGSRAFVENLGGLSVRAVVNVDSVGRALLRPVHILGLSTHPDLARDIAVRLEEQDLRIGPDIDRFGYEHGSDHWPFHEKGIPAVTLWASDYATMNTVSDTPDRLEYPGIARLARALRRFCTEPGSYVQ